MRAAASTGCDYFLHQLIEILLDRVQQRLQSIRPERWLRRRGLNGAFGRRGSNRALRKHRAHRFFGRRLAIDELAMQHVLATSHQPEHGPIGHRQKNYAENADLKHNSRPIGQVSLGTAILVKSARVERRLLRAVALGLLSRPAGPARNACERRLRNAGCEAGTRRQRRCADAG